jgi:hypothetical protein
MKAARWPWRGIVAAFCVALGVTQAVAADRPDIFTVANIHVDESAGAATDARTTALAKGERQAFAQLFRRLTLKGERLPQLSGEALSGVVQDFAVANEKNSRVRYIADLTYRFKAAAVRNLMREYHVRYAETPSKPMLILPLYEVGGTMALWEDPNPWKKAWTNAPPRDGLVPIVVPPGDLTDIGTINAQQAANGEDDRINAMAKRFGVDTVIVAHATLAPGSRPGEEQLDIAAVTFGPIEREQTLVSSVKPTAGETSEALAARAQTVLVEMIEDDWKRANLLQFGQNAVMIADMPLSSLSEWVEAQKRFKSVAVIQKVDLVLMSRTEARFNLYYLGDTQQLRLALAQQDMTLTEGEGAYTVNFNTRAKQGARR